MPPSRSPHDVASIAARPRFTGGSLKPRTPEQLDEARALHRVFLELSGRYEEHCRRGGEAESPAVCAAAVRFRKDRSLGSLVSFADRLDELDIPAPARGRRRVT